MNACPDKKEKKVKEKQRRKEEVGSVCDRQRKSKRMGWRRGEVPPEMEERFKWQNAWRREGEKKDSEKREKRWERGNKREQQTGRERRKASSPLSYLLFTIKQISNGFCRSRLGEHLFLSQCCPHTSLWQPTGGGERVGERGKRCKIERETQNKRSFRP